MGYTYAPKYGYIEVHTNPNNAILHDTTLRDSNLNPFAAIPYTGTLAAAYLDIIIPCTRNVKAGANNIDTGQLQLQDSGSTWRTALLLPVCHWCNNGTTYIGDVSYCGSTDIKAYIQRNTVMNVRLYQHQADGDAMYFYGVYNRLRLYFE